MRLEVFSESYLSDMDAMRDAVAVIPLLSTLNNSLYTLYDSTLCDPSTQVCSLPSFSAVIAGGGGGEGGGMPLRPLTIAAFFGTAGTADPWPTRWRGHGVA